MQIQHNKPSPNTVPDITKLKSQGVGVRSIDMDDYLDALMRGMLVRLS